MPDALQTLADAISAGSATTDTQMLAAMRGIFGHRYHKRSAPSLDLERPLLFRNAYGRGGGETEHVAYAGFINPDNPTSGPYGGCSIVWFPREEGCLIAFGIGTRGLNPDEGILTRPGHRRRIASLRRHLVEHGADTAWARQDPATVGVPVPDIVSQRLAPWSPVFRRYGSELYCLAAVPKSDPAKAKAIVKAFLDVYAYERRWEALKDAKFEVDEFIASLNASWLAGPGVEDINSLLDQRRFVVLEGPPGTGKTRLAERILAEKFEGNGLVTQFHPSTTYEDFVTGLSPDVTDANLRFAVRKGHLLRAADLARTRPALLVVDEINRADLGRVLGEAIFLLEADASPRKVQLPHRIDDDLTFELPRQLHILATMNTADRSVARRDLAIRRRFAFVTVMPDRRVVLEHSTLVGLDIFDALCDLFVEFAPDDALALLPGHSYFIAAGRDEGALRVRLRHELLPLIDEYVREGYLGPATAALHAVRTRIADAAEQQAVSTDNRG